MPDVPTSLRPAVFHILLALAGASRHGLGIAQAVDETTGGAVALGPGTLYRSLKEMLRDGLIEEASSPSDDDDPRRRYYALTESGRTAVQREAARMAQIVEVARQNRVLPESP